MSGITTFSTNFTPPPTDGSLTVMQMLDWHYVHNSSHPLFVYAPTSSGSESPPSKVAVTWGEVVEAVYTGAKLLKDRVPSIDALNAEGKPKVIGVLSHSDSISYYTTVLAIIRANCVPFPIYPKNSPQAVAHLIQKVGVTHVLLGYDQNMQHLMERAVEFLEEDFGYTKEKIPGTSMIPVFEDLYLSKARGASSEGQERVNKIREEIPLKALGPKDIQFYLHSSGSTALPKPLPWTSLGVYKLTTCTRFAGRSMTGKVFSIHVVPVFHAMGTFHIFSAISTGIVFGVFPPQIPPVQASPENVLEGARRVGAGYLLSVPSVIEAWSQNPSYVKWLAGRNGVFYSGGPLDIEVGTRLSEQGVPLSCTYGSTECGVMSEDPPREVYKDAWNYFRFSKGIKAQLIPNEDVDGSDAFEVIISGAPYHPGPQVVNTTIDGVDGYSTHDLIEEHPKYKGYWKILGRIDSKIIHSSGENTNPGPLESIMNQDPHVNACVMFGHGKFQAGIIVEPTMEEREPFIELESSGNVDEHEREAKLSEFRNKIWPTVEKMNAIAPQHSRIFKEMILIASPSKPFLFTAKRTTRNAAIIRGYTPEIEALYANLEESTQPSIPIPQQWDLQSSKAFVRAVVEKVLIKHQSESKNGTSASRAIKDDDDFFQIGGDSLQATWIKNSIMRALRDGAKIDTRGAAGNFVYEYPTIGTLGAFVASVVENKSLDIAVRQQGPDAQVEVEVQGMNRMVEKYSKDFRVNANLRIDSPTRKRRKVVLMTGSTGGVGAHILDRLLEDSTVEKVYALIRRGKGKSKDGAGSDDIKTKQKEAFVERGVDSGLVESSKLVLLEAQLSEERFGLEEDVFEKLKKEVTHVVANAWRVDFNLGLGSFESDIKGIRSMVDFALATDSLLVFTSSIGIFRRFNYAKERPFLEAPISAKVASAGGYSQSKWVSEQIIQSASSIAGLRSVIVRLGQACGSPNGSWNSKEWLPALVKSAPSLGCIVDDDREISWIPADLVARAFRDFLDAPETETRGNPSFVHLIHPRPARWSSLVRTIASKLNVDVVPFGTWLEKLEEAGKKDKSAEEKISALRILPSYQAMGLELEEAFGMALIRNERAKRLSKTLADPDVPQLGQEDLERWMAYWGL
ncbi:acetyl-CoA synthetase-like protein [Dendrothele bispora CBS 962.96]|uniref:Acetyl-CoA synthetase-like protein n=1 Tax=Dendrothele bispora (strain CBS 962.96) TaxID=1314807 RepID=A0A4S8MXR1_DENBC|nr:acetyl-CoA synthetase-like protein [Dendrothele bispora CBS 962.96]